MQIDSRIPCRQLAMPLALALFSMLSVGTRAADKDVTTVRLQANGSEQTVDIDMTALSEGQTRQLATTSGLPAIVTRTAEGLIVEVAGVRNEIALPAVEWVELDGETGSAKQVKVIHIDAETSDDGATSSESRHVVRVFSDAGEAPVTEAEIAELMAQAEAAAAEAGDAQATGDGKVIVIRKIEKGEEQ